MAHATNPGGLIDFLPPPYFRATGQPGPATAAHTIGSAGGSNASRSGGSSQVRPDIRRKRSNVVD